MRWQWSRIARRIRVPMGFAFAALYLWRMRPTKVTLLCSLAMVIPGLLLRAYASGYVKKNSELTRSGPYAYTRNPLYLGSLAMAAGFAIASRSLPVEIALAILFPLIYVPTILSEERWLREHFPDFDEYVERVPRLLPRFRSAYPHSARGQSAGFSLALYRQHGEYNAALGVIAIYVALAFKLWFFQ